MRTFCAVALLALQSSLPANAQLLIMKDYERFEQPDRAVHACTELLRMIPDSAAAYHRGVGIPYSVGSQPDRITGVCRTTTVAS